MDVLWSFCRILKWFWYGYGFGKVLVRFWSGFRRVLIGFGMFFDVLSCFLRCFYFGSNVLFKAVRMPVFSKCFTKMRILFGVFHSIFTLLVGFLAKAAILANNTSAWNRKQAPTHNAQFVYFKRNEFRPE